MNVAPSPASVSAELLRAWHAFYDGEFPWREPYTAGNGYDDMMDARTLNALERVLAADRAARRDDAERTLSVRAHDAGEP